MSEAPLETYTVRESLTDGEAHSSTRGCISHVDTHKATSRPRILRRACWFPACTCRPLCNVRATRSGLAAICGMAPRARLSEWLQGQGSHLQMDPSAFSPISLPAITDRAFRGRAMRSMEQRRYRGTSPMRNRHPLGPYSRPMPRALR
jgi:hypothetical protein